MHRAGGSGAQFRFQGKQLRLRRIKVRRVDIDRGLGQGSQQRCHAAGVVVVAVGQQDLVHSAVQLFYGREDQLRLRAGIDHGAGMGIFVTEKIAVGADGANL